jgi:hypothetical protein
MRCFFAEHTAVERSTRDATFSSPRANGGDEEGRHFVQCEEQLLSAFDA